MIANQAAFLSLLDGKKQFNIPIYQRTYSWKLKQCQQLFDDILMVGGNAEQKSHFIGSVVYFQPSVAPTTSVPEYLVIDGQQRLTTVSLLLLALIHFLKKHDDDLIEEESWEEIQESYLVNRHKKDDSKYKLLLTRRDKETYSAIVNEMEVSSDDSSRVVENYEFFKKKLTKENIEQVYHGIKKLIIVDVILERDKDDPQLIFESLNSTGLDLSQADLIRNYILMGQPVSVQTELYEKYWYPMEKLFGDKIDWLKWFFRDYLTMKKNEIPKIEHIYEAYKDFLKGENGPASISDAVRDLYTFSQYYTQMVLHTEKDQELLALFKEISKLKMDVAYPFLIACYHDYKNGHIEKSELIEILQIVKNYVFRRAICGIPTNSLNKTFASLYKKVKVENYLESIKAAFVLMDSYRRFPTDSEFEEEFMLKDVYNFRLRNYLLESLENYKRKELVQADNYTIEHIMPQNENVSPQWQQELGEDWRSVHEKYLHTIGNLTLTGYNSELSDRPFSEKRTIEGGFNHSPLTLNDSVRKEDVWNKDAITRRASSLAAMAASIWTYPDIDEQSLARFKEVKTGRETQTYTLEQYEHLKGDMLALYEHLEKRVLNIDPSVRVEFKKLYIAFKSQTNFVDVVPQKSKLRLSLNIDFESIIDPEGICRDISNLGRWGNGDVEVALETSTDMDYVMELIQQAFDIQVESE